MVAEKAKSISDDGEILLQSVDTSGAEIKGDYKIWRPTGPVLSHVDEKFKAERMTKDGTVVGSYDHTRLHAGVEVTETHAVFWPPDTFGNAAPVDLTPTPETYNKPENLGEVETDWLLTHMDSMGLYWWTAADPALQFKGGREIIWRGRIIDRNRGGVLAGEATIVHQARLWNEWKALAQSDPFQAQNSVPLTDAGSAVRWLTAANNPPSWEYLVDNLSNLGEATAYALNDDGVSVGGIGFNAQTPEYLARFGDNLAVILIHHPAIRRV